MKNLTIIVITLLFFISCKNETGSKADTDRSNYLELTGDALESISFAGSSVKGSNDLQANLNIRAKEDKMVLPDNKDYAFYKLFVTADGNVSSVKSDSVESLSTYNRTNVEVIKSWKFKPVFINQKKQNVCFDFIFIPVEHTSDLYTLLLKEEEVVGFNKEYYAEVVEMPEIIGGIESIRSKIVYPKKAKQSGIQGSVFMKVYVDETGKVTKASVTRGIGYGCDIASLEAISKTSFKPAKMNDKPVKVQVILPIKFKLN